MNYLVYDLGRLRKGDIVEFTLDKQANVKLMDQWDYREYKNGRSHNYYGGLAKVSPIHISVPKDYTYWYATVDLGGYEGSVNASVKVIEKPSEEPEIHEDMSAASEETITAEEENTSRSTVPTEEEEEAAARDTASPEETEGEPRETKKTPKKGKKAIILIILAVLFILIALAVYVFVLKDLFAYNAAGKRLSEGKYEEAKTAYLLLGDYKDSADMASECDYQMAQELLSAGQYEQAREIFTTLGSYRASPSMVKECDYQKAAILYKNGEYADAYAIYSTIKQYKDVHSIIAEDARLASIEERDQSWVTRKCITFGSYAQTRSGNDTTPIEWYILNRDGNKVLLISKYALDSKPFNEGERNATWESCSLRKWLNADFLKTAFSDAEKNAILETEVDNSAKQGFHCMLWDSAESENTQDRIFLLSYKEVQLYCSTESIEACVPTDYAIANGAWTSKEDYVNGCAVGKWWLRTSGINYHSAMNVGGGTYQDVNSEGYSVRPAMWIDIYKVQ